MNDIDEAGATAVIEVLGVEPEEVTPDATLLGDLGAESIDLLDILFRLERSTGPVQADPVTGGAA